MGKARQGIGAAIHHFCRDEAGNLIIFTLFTFMAMAIAVATGIDVVRAEILRTKLQNTSDRAVLAAADLEQTLTPQEVVNDYFEREGLDTSLVDVSSTSEFGNREVVNTTELEMPTMLLRLVGNSHIDVPAKSIAGESISKVEISLVLDYSMSMRGSKYTSLIDAAGTFVDTIFDGPIGPGASINYVPYAGTVNVGPELFSLLGGTRIHSNSSCVEHDAAHFSGSQLPSGPLEQVPHFERYWRDDPTIQWGWCPPDENQILAANTDRDALKHAISTSLMNGGTGTDIAMKYGVALLDPAARDTLTSLRSATTVTAKKPMAGRPLDWSDPDTQKYIVLMTDGGITSQLRPKYTGLIDEDENNDDDEADLDEIDGIDYDKINAEVLIHKQQEEVGSGGQKTKRNKNASLNNFYAQCDAAKNNGVIVFTIAYNAPSSAQQQMLSCASAPGMYYDIQDLDINAAFGSIALQINRLRLTF